MTSAGDLRHRLRFESPAARSDGAGNFEDGWQEEFTVSARLQPRYGGEAVIAARLTGTQPFLVTVRGSSQSRRIISGWRVVDVRTGTVYAITSPAADMAQDGAFLEFIAATGRGN